MSQQTLPQSLLVRDAQESDMQAIYGIYRFYVLHGLATFEEVPPTIQELILRRKAIRDAGLPYLVATINHVPVGYAYAGVYRPRPAYRYTVEDSVYVAEAFQAKGIGSALLSATIERCAKSNCRQMVAVIGDSANTSSIALHRRFGFTHTGTLTAVGFKFNRWVDTVLMQKALGEGQRSLPLPPPTVHP